MRRIAKKVVWTSAIVIGLGIGLYWLLGLTRSAPPSLQIRFAPKAIPTAPLEQSASRSAMVVPDDLCLKFYPPTRLDFHVSSRPECAIYVQASGVQTSSPAGWKTAQEEYRGEIWRLKADNAHELCVEQPPPGKWRVFLRYGTEIEGFGLLKLQLLGVWKSRSFSNWSGKAWGGGRFGGQYELYLEGTNGGRPSR
jgi:hypothetical protein